MKQQEAIRVLRPQWERGDWAKSSGELLWSHHFTVWNVARKLAAFSSSTTDQKQRLLELACLVHDIGKMSDKCQQRLRAGGAPGDHKLEKQDIEHYFLGLLDGEISVTEDEIQQIWDMARTHHSVGDRDLEVQVSVDVDLFQLLRFSDWIASMERPDFETISRVQQQLGRVIRLTYFHFSRFDSPASCLAVQTGLDAYKAAGWMPLVVFPNGSVLVSDGSVSLPNREAVSRDLERAIIKGSLTLQKPVPTGYTGDFLTLLSKQYPELLLEANAARLTTELGSVNRAMVFLKLVRDILASRNAIDNRVKQECPLLSIVDSANSTAAHPKAKEKYQAIYNLDPPAKVNRDMLDPLFEQAKLGDVVPSSYAGPLPRTTELKTASATELLDVLKSLAIPTVQNSPEAETSELQRYLHACLAMEEETDFAAIASEIFESYKTYKRTSSAEKGVCERCASPVAGKMQPGLNFATAPQAFSQIKPKYQYRAVCPLCGYDNLVVRSGIRRTSSRVFIRLETKIAELLADFEPLQYLVTRIETGLRYPRDLARLQEFPGCENLPFPKRLPIPVRDIVDEVKPAELIRLDDRGILLPIALTDGSRGPRDLRGQYEPVYHVLRFLGYQVAIGTEDQMGLFGKPVPTTRDSYLRSLAVILLADQVDKKSNKYVYASELLARSPSVALTYAAGDGRERFGMKQKLLTVFLRYLTHADEYALHEKERVTMKHLLEDAAFLSPSLVAVETDNDDDGMEVEGEDATPTPAPEAIVKRKRRGGMWTFCEHNASEKLTKHSATKPISQALDQLMLGRGVDFALNKFMQNLSVRVKNENATELAEFVRGVRVILDNAEQLRQQNVTDFLRYKNGLLSAVYMLTRYPDLKTVIQSDKE